MKSVGTLDGFYGAKGAVCYDGCQSCHDTSSLEWINGVCVFKQNKKEDRDGGNLTNWDVVSTLSPPILCGRPALLHN